MDADLTLAILIGAVGVIALWHLAAEVRREYRHALTRYRANRYDR